MTLLEKVIDNELRPFYIYFLSFSRLSLFQERSEHKL